MPLARSRRRDSAWPPAAARCHACGGRAEPGGHLIDCAHRAHALDVVERHKALLARAREREETHDAHNER